MATKAQAVYNYINEEIVPDVHERFRKKQMAYQGGDEFMVLGLRGQFADIHRKVGKLKTAMWDGKPEDLLGEPLEEVLADLIGHCFLSLGCLAFERGQVAL